MSEAKPTPGPWDLWGYSNPSQTIAAPTGFVAQTLGGNDEANARLIADAGTVFNTTGLTPSQLVERVKELEELEEVVLRTAGYLADKDWALAALEIREAASAIRAALSKARPNTAEGE